MGCHSSPLFSLMFYQFLPHRPVSATASENGPLGRVSFCIGSKSRGTAFRGLYVYGVAGSDK